MYLSSKPEAILDRTIFFHRYLHQSWVQTTGQNKKNEKECTFASVIQVGTMEHVIWHMHEFKVICKICM